METTNLPTAPSTPDPMIDWAIEPVRVQLATMWNSPSHLGPYFIDTTPYQDGGYKGCGDDPQIVLDEYYNVMRKQLEHLRLSELEWEECMAGGSRYITSNAGQFVYTVEKGNEKYYACINFSSKRLHSGALVYFEPFETEEVAIQAIQQERIRLAQQILGL